MTKQYDAIVIGGGHNGLVAAGYLAHAGLHVLVLERREVVGGPCGNIEYFPGYTAAFSNSPGSLEPKIVRDLRLGEFGLEFARPDPSLVFTFDPDRSYIGWRDRNRTHEQFAALSRKDADNYARFFQYIETFARTLNVNLYEDPPAFADLAARAADAGMEADFSKIMLGSIYDLLHEWFETEEIRALVASQAIVNNFAGPHTPGTPARLLHRPMAKYSVPDTTDGHDPRSMELRGSTGIPIGGMGSITASMRRSIEAHGGEVHTETNVTAIIVTEDNRVGGVALEDGTEITAPLVLSNLNPKTTYLDLLPSGSIPSSLVDSINSLVMRGSPFKIGLALDEPPLLKSAPNAETALRMAGCQFRIAPSLDYMERAFDDAKYGEPAQGPLIWGLTPSVIDPSVTPPGRHVMSLNIFHAPRNLAEGDWKSRKHDYAKHCLKTVFEYIPNLESSITDMRVWSPEDVEEEFGMVGANITHGDMLPNSMFRFRPTPESSNYRAPIDGLYLCGSGMWPGGLITGIPGHNASQRALDDLRITEATS